MSTEKKRGRPTKQEALIKKLAEDKANRERLNLEDKDESFWYNVMNKESGSGRWINFVDDEPIVVTILDWRRHFIETNWGDKPVLITKEDRYLKIESERLCKALAPYALQNKPATLEITRFDSKPDSRKTWYLVQDI